MMTAIAALFGIGLPCAEISDDEASEVSSNDYAPAAPIRVKPEKNSKSKSKTPVDDPEPEPVAAVESDGGDDDEEELAEDEYTVEAITNHFVDEDTGVLRFEVKWLGFEKKSDRTWEPEENLFETASEILDKYLSSVGGKEAILAAWEERKAEAGTGKKGKKRGRTSAGEKTNGTKKGRKSKEHPASGTPPLSATSAEFKPPGGTWEDAVIAIDACEGNDSNVVVYLTWKGGHKTQHPLAQVYKRCPQKMLAFYESHLVFKKNDDLS
ncbi:heterochromatin protein one [Drepanopeziza brunnea f. sp. 'multigermtubi' MB_m1]|uniref:Heterochromatin protein one n=1 Tax=Marssonina brunnea f. sp. multigermtubi (strain MB_m1) TaxID=1072389 RepID=K1XN52_MARBU|nr:heterochromatin protein one [Drepanopeziza brunnea f. sp. 'multigermtubi' MB_m1]EKD13924.1 heterochromatin protein one [Drepanopeziza brunnea f. sp. 'multigermtubi' MB_m1]